MGNNSSLPPHKRKLGRRIQNDEDGTECEAVQEIVEINEISENDRSTESDTPWQCCAHSCIQYDTLICHECFCKFIPVKDLFNVTITEALEKLPEPVRHVSLLKYINIEEKLVVKLEVRKCHTGTIKYDTATGYVWCFSENVQIYAQCPLENCALKSGCNHKAYGGLIVYTNKHVINNITDAKNCKVEFFYNDYHPPIVGSETGICNADQVSTGDTGNAVLSGKGQSSIDTVTPNLTVETDGAANGTVYNHSSNGDIREKEMKLEMVGNNLTDFTVGNNSSVTMTSISLDQSDCTAYGDDLRTNKENKDLVELKIVFHNPELFDIIMQYSSQKMEAFGNIPQALQSTLKKHAIVISHPHAQPKQVSFGTLLSLEERDWKGRKVTSYNAATCQGSSGAPVLNFHGPWRHFVHSCKIKTVRDVKKKNSTREKYINQSFSY